MDNLEYIDTYFSGGHPPEEAREFERKIQEDPAFAEEVTDYLGALAALKEANSDERKTRFLELYRQSVDLPSVRKMNPWLTVGAAAAILTIVALSWLLFLQPANAAQVADRYIRENLSVLPLKMGTVDPIQTGINYFNDGRLTDALHQFEALLGADSVNPTLLQDAGIVSLRLQQFDQALDYFSKLQKHTDLRVTPALFYQALTLMRRNRPGDSDHAKQQLRRIVQEGLNRKEDAQELLGKM